MIGTYTPPCTCDQTGETCQATMHKPSRPTQAAPPGGNRFERRRMRKIKQQLDTKARMLERDRQRILAIHPQD